jgi:hypothetical protein
MRGYAMPASWMALQAHSGLRPMVRWSRANRNACRPFYAVCGRVARPCDDHKQSRADECTERRLDIERPWRRDER